MAFFEVNGAPGQQWLQGQGRWHLCGIYQMVALQGYQLVVQRVAAGIQPDRCITFFFFFFTPPPFPFCKNKACMKSSLILPSLSTTSSMFQPALPVASMGCWREVSNSQFPAGRVPVHDFALLRALFLLLQHKPFLGRFFFTRRSIVWEETHW